MNHLEVRAAERVAYHRAQLAPIQIAVTIAAWIFIAGGVAWALL